MCGLFGALGPLADGALDRASTSLAHRGPDAEGRFQDLSLGSGVPGGVHLLHRRLKIIDLSESAAQPMPNEDGSVQVVFNGEIYNHRALRSELEANGHRFRSRSDTEVIVHGYEQWGEEVVARLSGMFAIAIWDRPRRRLVLARDRVGKKPLFHATHAGTFYFGSTVASLHAAGLHAAVNATALPFYLSYGFVPPPRTLHAHVAQLPEAHLLVRDGDFSPRTRRYWAPSFQADARPLPLAAAARRVRTLVEQAVERRLEADVPLGAFLSGGVDSTIVVGVMARLLGNGKGRVRTFSIGFAGDPRYDETRYARIASRAFGTEHTEFVLRPSSFDLVEDLVRHHDGPFGDSSAIPTSVVSRLTRAHVTVALSGDGGDELFCGYQRFLAAEAAELLPRPVRAALANAAAALPGATRERSLWGKASRFLAAAALPLDERMARWNSYFTDPREILRADVAASLEAGGHLDAPLAWQRAVFASCHGDSTIARVLEHNFRTYLPCDLLVKADRSSMAHALEVRSPFLDDALIAYAQTLPPSYLRRGRETKRVLKLAFDDLLPPEIKTRGKMGFGVPLSTWFRGGLAGYLRERLGPSARMNAWVDERVVARLLAEHAAGARDHSARLWALLTLELWLRTAPEALACAA